MNEQLDFVFQLYNAVQEENINYIYRGHFNHLITENILNLAESNIVDAEEKSIVKKKVYHIMVECLQNITKHQAIRDRDRNEEAGIFFIQRKSNTYYITTGNLIHFESIDTLKNKIEKVNSLNKDELTDYYKETLITGELSDKGGAGLGLIDMARKSGNKLASAFRQIDNEFSFFYLHTAIPSKEKTDDNANQVISEAKLDTHTSLHSILFERNILLIFNSYFSQESLMNLLNMIEGQLADTMLKKKTFSLMVEMFQNIVHHGSNNLELQGGKPGLFFLSETPDSLILNSGNYIKNEDVEILSEKIAHLNSLSISELNEQYDKTLMNFESDTHIKAGLGFIDMRLKSGSLLDFNIHQIDDKVSFFTLSAKILKFEIDSI